MAINRDLVIKYQFGYVLRQLLKVDSWLCPMTKHNYVGAELLITYLNCFRLMSKDQDEYQPFVDIAVKIIDEKQWKDVVVYGLDKKT